MLILKVISLLLDYPDEHITDNREAIKDIIAESTIDPNLRERLIAFVDNRCDKELMLWQSEYDGMFERGRSLGLWLFEHVHGESRDRGQAMVDLIAQYKEAGLSLDRKELPDYIPLFLEFLSTQGEDNARAWLQDVEHILAILLARLEKRGSDYAVLFSTLLSIAGCAEPVGDIRQQVKNESPDHTPQAIDREWEEEEVTFGADSLDSACESSRRRPEEKQRRDLDVPLHWVGFQDPAPANAEQQSDQTSVVEGAAQ